MTDGILRYGGGAEETGDDLLSDPVVGDFLERLRAAGTGPAPQPSDELRAILHDNAVAGSRRPTLVGRHRWGRRSMAGVAAAGLMVAGVGAAAADVLPPPFQRVVSDVVATWTPWRIPRAVDPRPADLARPPAVAPVVRDDATVEPAPETAEGPAADPAPATGTIPPVGTDAPSDSQDRDTGTGAGTSSESDGVADSDDRATNSAAPADKSDDVAAETGATTEPHDTAGGVDGTSSSSGVGDADAPVDE